jgi:hypothetical protein
MQGVINPTLGQLSPTVLGAQVAAGAGSFLAQQLGPELARAAQAAVTIAVSAHASGGIHGLTGSDDIRKAIAAAIAQSVTSRLAIPLTSGLADRLTAQIIPTIPGLQQMLGSAPADGPIVNKASLRAAVVERAILPPSMPAADRSARALRFDDEVRTRSLEAVALAWNLRSGVERAVQRIG